MNTVAQGHTIAVRGLSDRDRAPMWRLRLRSRELLSRSLVIVPGVYLVGAIALGIMLPALDRTRGGGRLLGIDTPAAQSILEAIASGMIAFAGLVVSVAVVVVQFGAGQYSPRLVQSFRRDPVIKNALGLFVAPGVYALTAAADVGGSPHDKPATMTVAVGLLLMVMAIVALFRFIGRLLDLMRPRRIYARLLESIRPAIEDVYPFMLSDVIEERAAPDAPVSATLRHAHRDEILAAVDRARLVSAAQAAGGLIEVCVPVGAHIVHDAPILLVRGGSGIDEHELRRALLFADGRLVEQDPAFAIRCIVDVGIRALSPAINDPTSAVECLDGLDGLLARLSRAGWRGQRSSTRTVSCESSCRQQAGMSWSTWRSPRSDGTAPTHRKSRAA